MLNAQRREGRDRAGEKTAWALSAFQLHLLFLFAQTSLWRVLSASGLCSNVSSSKKPSCPPQLDLHLLLLL